MSQNAAAAAAAKFFFLSIFSVMVIWWSQVLYSLARRTRRIVGATIGGLNVLLYLLVTILLVVFVSRSQLNSSASNGSMCNGVENDANRALNVLQKVFACSVAAGTLVVGAVAVYFSLKIMLLVRWTRRNVGLSDDGPASKPGFGLTGFEVLRLSVILLSAVGLLGQSGILLYVTFATQLETALVTSLFLTLEAIPLACLIYMVGLPGILLADMECRIATALFILSWL